LLENHKTIPQTMRAVEIEQPGGPAVLKLTQRPTPAPGPGEVLIRVAAAGINRPDILQRRGLYPPPPGASDLPGLEAAGEIASLGDGVAEWKIGDKVCALLSGGGYADYAAAPCGSCLPIPANLTMAQAAALPETYITVWANVFDDASLQPGETLLVHGGASGIGTTAIAFAKAIGAKAITTAGTNEKCIAAMRLGADAAYHYEKDNWSEQIAQSGGADVVLDMTGGDFMMKNLACLNQHGRHVSIAFIRGMEPSVNILMIMQKRLRLSGSTLRNRPPAEKARLAKAMKQTIWPLIEAGKLAPLVDRTFDLADAAKAHELMESGGHIGKIVLEVSEL